MAKDLYYIYRENEWRVEFVVCNRSYTYNDETSCNKVISETDSN